MIQPSEQFVALNSAHGFETIFYSGMAALDGLAVLKRDE